MATALDSRSNDAVVAEMTKRPAPIPAGTQVVTRAPVRGTNDAIAHPRGAVRERLLAVEHGNMRSSSPQFPRPGTTPTSPSGNAVRAASIANPK